MHDGSLVSSQMKGDLFKIFFMFKANLHARKFSADVRTKKIKLLLVVLHSVSLH